MSIISMRHDAMTIFDAAVKAADPHDGVRRALLSLGDRVLGAADRGGVLRIVAIGKAAVAMAEAAASVLDPSRFTGPGLVVTNYENARPCDRFEVLGAGHPVPDAAGQRAAERIEAYVGGASPEDGLLVLISGGGSALVPSPAHGITLGDEIELTEALLACGAAIDEINTVRKHISRLKGGGLARIAAPAPVASLIVSDVVGDDISTIASGPTAPDPTTFADAAAVLRKARGAVPPRVLDVVSRGREGDLPETPKPDDPLFALVENRVIAGNAQSVDAARRKAVELGYGFVPGATHTGLEPISSLGGEARRVGENLAWYMCNHSRPGKSAIVLGGETTVVVQGRGLGGRNQELALSFAIAAHARAGKAKPQNWVLLSGGTDGRDGPTDAAGGIVDAGTIDRLHEAGVSPAAALDDNDSLMALKASGDLLISGPTGTNVADVVVLLRS